MCTGMSWAMAVAAISASSARAEHLRPAQRRSPAEPDEGACRRGVERGGRGVGLPLGGPVLPSRTFGVAVCHEQADRDAAEWWLRAWARRISGVTGPASGSAGRDDGEAVVAGGGGEARVVGDEAVAVVGDAERSGQMDRVGCAEVGRPELSSGPRRSPPITQSSAAKPRYGSRIWCSALSRAKG